MGFKMTISKVVEDYIESHPYILQTLEQGLINHSALARKISEDVEGSFEAIKMSIHRYREQLVEESRRRRKEIREVLDSTEISLRNNVTVCEEDCESGGIEVVTANSRVTFNRRDGCGGKKLEDQVLISLKSEEKIEDIPGVLSHVLSLLAGAGINVTEVISCAEDTHLAVGEEDAVRAFDILNRRI